jgi:hypothetical protein
VRSGLFLPPMVIAPSMACHSICRPFNAS